MQTDLLMLQGQPEVSFEGNKGQAGKSSNALGSSETLNGEDPSFLSTLLGIGNGQNLFQVAEFALLNATGMQTTGKDYLLKFGLGLGSSKEGGDRFGQSLNGRLTATLLNDSELEALKVNKNHQLAGQEGAVNPEKGFTGKDFLSKLGVEQQKAGAGTDKGGVTLSLKDSELDALKLDKNSPLAGQINEKGPVISDEAGKNLTRYLELEHQNINALNTKSGSFYRDFLSNKAVKLNTDGVENALLSSNNQLSDKISETMLPTKEPEIIKESFQADVLKQIVEKAVLSLKNGETAIKISLKPEFLGNVQLKISTDDHQIMVKVLTDNFLVKEIIENNINQLKTGLQNHGLEIDKFDVFVANDSNQNGNDYERSPYLKTQGENDEEEVSGAAANETEETSGVGEERKGEGLIDFFA
jgi:hypothetical protein